MPIYNYRCQCGWRSGDKIRKVGTKTIPCEECRGTAKRIVSRIGMLRFKGGGWSVRRPVEAFEGESEYTDDWGKEEE